MSYIKRQLVLAKSHSLLLFGARNTGKSTLIKMEYDHKQAFWIDLLNNDEAERYSREPTLLTAEVLALSDRIKYVIIDEIQKVPKLLDTVHQLIEKKLNKFFILTGSSARKLRHGGANLLAGRAFVYHLYPFTSFEIATQFNLENALRFGMLPTIFELTQQQEKILFLQSYAQTYLKEEIWLEQVVRNLEPFRRFLEVSAQANGKIVNILNIARDVGVDSKTVKEYFNILKDTLIGFFLEPFQHSFRKRLSQKPKFYYFDTGVARALSRQLSLPLNKSTSAYGEAFEHFIILECMKLAHYYKTEFRFSYLRTKDDAEVDLIIERPGLPILFVEIKSSENIHQADLSSFIRLVNDFGQCEAICLSNDKHAKKFGNILVLPWQEGLKQIFFDNI